MAVRGVALVSLALFVGIAAFVLHLLAMSSPRWKITKRDAEPVMAPVSYGLWQRCETLNLTITKQGVALGMRPNVPVCRPNRYMRYSADNYEKCYHIRRNCPVIQADKLPEGCYCRYLPSTKGLQWLTVLAAICLAIGILILYLRAIATPHNNAATFVLNLGPFICFVLTLLLMVTALILVGAYLRRDTYEDNSFPLQSVSNNTAHLLGFDLYSLRKYAKHYASTFSHDSYLRAEKELRDDANTHYHTNIGWATGLELIATALVFVGTALTFFLGVKARSDES